MITAGCNSRNIVAALRNLLAVALVAVISWSNSANAAIIPQFTLIKDPSNGIPFSAPDATLPSPWVSYRLSVTATAGEQMQAFQVDIRGQLHQRWTDADGDQVFEPTASSTAASGLTNGDSHLLGRFDLFFGGPSEDNPGTGSPLASTATALYGVGTYLNGAFSLTTPATTANLAYLVLAKNTTTQISARILVANSQGDIISDINFPNFPEPTSAVLATLALAGLVATVRQRRNS